MKKIMLIGIFVIFLLVPSVSSGIGGAEPTNNWDTFSDWFFGLFGVEPNLQLQEVKQNIKTPTQKYKLKDVEDKTISVEIKKLTNANYDNLRFRIYEDNICTRRELKTVPDIKNGTNTYYENVEYSCPSYNEYPISELQNKRNSVAGFFEPEFMIDWGEMPQENCVDTFYGTYCEQKVDLVVSYAGREYVEFAQWLQTSGSWNGEFSNTEEDSGKIVLIDSTERLLFDGFPGSALNTTNWIETHEGGNVVVEENILKLWSLGDGLASIVQSKSSAFSSKLLGGDCFILDVKDDLDEGLSSFRFFMNGTTNGEVMIFGMDYVNSYDYFLKGGTNITVCMASNGTSVESIYFNETEIQPSDMDGTASWDLGSLSGDKEFVLRYKRNVAGSSDFHVHNVYLDSSVSYSEGNFTSIGKGNGTEYNWDELEYLGFNNVEVRSSDDNSSWDSWVNGTHETDLGIDSKEYIQWRGWIFTGDEGEYVNISYELGNQAPNSATELKINASTDNNYTEDDIYAEFINGIDPDGDVVIYNISWYNEGVLNLTFGNLTNTTVITLETLENENTTQREDWAFSIITCDIPNYLCSSEVFSANITIRSQPPTTPTLQTPLNNSKIGNSSIVLFCDGSTDPDGDTIYYDIYADTNNPPTTLVNNSIDGIFNYTTEGNIYWRCRANDSTEYSNYTDSFYFQMNSVRIHNASLEYESSVMEGESTKYKVNVTINKWNTNDIDTVFNYNGTDYTTVKTIISTNDDIGIYEFERTLTIPNVDGESTMDGFWNFSLGLNDGTTEYNATYDFSQTVETGLIFECDGTVNTTQAFVMNITGYYELNNTKIVTTPGTNDTGFNLDIDLILYLNDITVNGTLNLDGTNITEYDICFSPPDRTFNISGVMEYTKTDYVVREYFFQEATLDNITNEIFLYFLGEDDAVKFFVDVKEGMFPFTDAIITISKYEPSSGTYKTVSVRKTDNIGEFVTYLDLDKQYKFSIVKEGVSYGTIEKKATCAEAPCEITLQVAEATEDLWQGYYDEFATSVAYSLIYNDTTKTVTYTFNDLTGLAQYFRLEVIETEYNQTGAVVCNNSLFTTAGTLTCNMTEKGYTKGDFSATGLISRSPEKIVDFIKFIISAIKDTLGTEGIFVSLLIIVTIAFVGAWNPSVGVIFTAVAVMLMKIIEFVAFGWTTVILIFIMAGIVAYNMGKT